MDEVLKAEGLSRGLTWDANYTTLMAEVESKEEGQHKIVPALTYYAAENMEYPVMGAFYEAKTFEEALEQYEQLPTDPNGSKKGIGFNLSDGSEYSGMYPLYQDEKGVSEMCALGDHCRESELVQAAFEKVKKQFSAPVVEQLESVADIKPEEPRIADLSHIREKPVAPDHSVPIKTPVAEKPEGKKDSVLNKLRQRQQQMKEREKEPKNKTHERKKGDISL